MVYDYQELRAVQQLRTISRYPRVIVGMAVTLLGNLFHSNSVYSFFCCRILQKINRAAGIAVFMIFNLTS